jgi:hypothetical protein
LNDKLVDCFRVDDMREACRAEVSAVGADGYVPQIDVGFHSCEADVTEPLPTRSTHYGTSRKYLNSPLLFDHVQEVTVIHYPFKYRPKRESVVPAERRGKPKNRDSFPNRMRVCMVFRTLNFRMKERQYAAVSEQGKKVSIST